MKRQGASSRLLLLSSMPSSTPLAGTTECIKQSHSNHFDPRLGSNRNTGQMLAEVQGPLTRATYSPLIGNIESSPPYEKATSYTSTLGLVACDGCIQEAGSRKQEHWHNIGIGAR